MRRPNKMTLPPEVVDDIEHIRDDWQARHLLRVYLGALIRAGWRQSSIARLMGVSRQRIVDFAIVDDYVEQSIEEYRLITGMTLPIPDAPIIVDMPPRPRGRRLRLPTPETTERLREVYADARRYRGSEKNRDAAHLFVNLVWYAHISEGASLYGIAKALGINVAALQSRLVRYGYKTSTGQSKNVQPLRGRPPRNSGSHCIHGHPLDEENMRVDPKSRSRICKACERDRSRKYKARKRALSGGAV